jgi:hypothetical protein
LIVAGVYLLIILFFIYKNGLFGIFTDKTISPAQFTFFFIFKCLAIPVFYYIYQTQYGGIENYDAGNFLRDSKTVNSIFYERPLDYLKLLFGFQNDAPGTELFSKFISKTNNWDEGVSWRLIFNDNRSLIRIHSLIHFISFNSYYVHALISCLLGYIGIGLIYRSLKHFFISKEIWLFGAFIFLPNLWLFSGALLKEPIELLNIGLILCFTDRLFNSKYSLIQRSSYVLILAFIVYYMRPQISLTVLVLYLLYKTIESFNLKYRTLWYVSSVVVTLLLINFAFLMFKNMSMFSFINKKQAEFYDVARGGIFLKDSAKFVRMSYKPEQVVEENGTYRIRSGVPFYYWEDSHQKDTLYCASNKDTLTTYKLIYQIVPANSGYVISDLHTNMSDMGTVFHGLFRGLGLPFKFNGFMSIVVSLEGLFLTLCLLLSLVGLFFVKEKIIILFFLFSSIFLLILFGIATPNLGAIVRYRCVISPFIVLALLYIINHCETGRIRKENKH